MQWCSWMGHHFVKENDLGRKLEDFLPWSFFINCIFKITKASFLLYANPKSSIITDNLTIVHCSTIVVVQCISCKVIGLQRKPLPFEYTTWSDDNYRIFASDIGNKTIVLMVSRIIETKCWISWTSPIEVTNKESLKYEEPWLRFSLRNMTLSIF